MELDLDKLSRVVAYMARLTIAGDGWINLIPWVGDGEERTSLGFFTLLSGGGSGVTMCTWVPQGRDRRGPVLASLGITHVTARRAAAALRSAGCAVPETWLVEQDHPRRGLVLRLPSGEDHEQVLGWALRAVGALGTPGPVTGWQADVHLPLDRDHRAGTGGAQEPPPATTRNVST
jgi:hypothetical protein